ncbi:MAG: D-alanyl-D-alanine carboxypeptidase/D-alanyl-D-alanine-endopeptidase [Alphaproteobacteria bacterium]|nr:MAG: D-alanyl-D-alanine carboxypeptidase/D-alanyl-D-alanine-endopeptidase [Alphaproteobacteria bacterium]
MKDLKPVAFTRRRFLATAAALVPATALAGAPETAPRPARRPLRDPAIAARPALDPRLSGQTGYALYDLEAGKIVEALAPDTAFVPASVSKIPTALYALDSLGADYRFTTRLLTTGSIVGGTLQGDLILVGGGDPTLDTDDLAELAAALRGAGIRRIAGRFLADGSALPAIAEIMPGQPVQAAYNPSVSGLNCNFNRVFLEWKPVKGGREIVLEARALRHSPAVSHVTVATAARRSPVFTWTARGGRELWTVAEPALRRKGGRWLPVRDSVAYTGDVFRQLAADLGIVLPQPQVVRAAAGREIARISSDPLQRILRQMLRYSTNLTAEAVGLAASRQRGLVSVSLTGSAAAMSEWLRDYAGLTGKFRFANHSGLTGKTRISPAQTVQLLAAAERRGGGQLRGLLKKIHLPAEGKSRQPLAGVVAKTGTLAFVRGLAGYLDGPNGKPYAFAIYADDLEARGEAELRRERPRGSRRWLSHAKAQEIAILQSWARRYAGA